MFCYKCEVSFDKNAKDIVSCVQCKNYFHVTCTRISTLLNFSKMGAKRSTWKCDGCGKGDTPSAGESGSDVSVTAEEEPRNSELMSTLHKIQEQLTKQLDERFLKVTGELSAMKITLETVMGSFKQLDEDNKELKNKCVLLEDQNISLRNELLDLKEEVRDLQQYTRQDNLEIIGVPCKQGENTYAVMEGIARTIGVSYKAEDISVAHRLPVTKKYPHPSIIVRFTSRRSKMEWSAAAKKKKAKASDIHSSFPSTPVYLNDHLTVHNKAVLARARGMVKAKQLSYAWVVNCRVLVRVTPESPAQRVTCIEDLDRLVARQQ